MSCTTRPSFEKALDGFLDFYANEGLRYPLCWIKESQIIHHKHTRWIYRPVFGDDMSPQQKFYDAAISTGVNISFEFLGHSEGLGFSVVNSPSIYTDNHGDSGCLNYKSLLGDYHIFKIIKSPFLWFLIGLRHRLLGRNNDQWGDRYP